MLGWASLPGGGPIASAPSVRAPEQAAAPARDAAGRPGIRLAGLMAYEAQIAGVGDDPPGRPVYGAAVRYLQRKSAAELALRRAGVGPTPPGTTGTAPRSGYPRTGSRRKGMARAGLA